MSLLTTILKQLINGLQSGSIYALVALGYSMVYGIIMLLNFAHGDIIMVGAYIVWLMMARFALNPIIALLAAIVGCTALGVVIEKAAYKPLRSSPRISLLITAIGISYFLENAAQLIFGANARVIPPFINAEPITVGAVSIPAEAAVTLAAAGIAMVLLNVLVKKTKMGKAMRAVSEDAGAAQLMGININNTISFTFAVGSALAGIGSVLYCCAYPKATPTMGSMLGLKAFVAAVLGGIGSIPGAMAGGFAIGIAEALVSSAGLSEWKDGVVFAILIIVLLVKPTGLMGRPMTEKV
ncbi:MAG: branched-chain amino acid ABC transporter permease [Eubacteriales bacterium]|jgi:branched-chain amino acid transport system permease protein|nr:branched-chain amino acid ABC transporter permease [Eubacteriales bacterium]MCI6979114.1 branched-chain amino acid ABC transporter permease [Clostridiales bacterium]MDD6722061.1 branched-chain amino acid ABC transporter permease [Clostridiales bacterium]MDY5693503.1 branched-chain amino acid ABC transporter permease [Eubacteriales bacterium]HZK46309.1 branched-chain amino acid ABC transporter permease [Clostridia bacterium]